MTYQVKIYKLINSFDNAIYIDSTKQSLSKRFWEHKNNSIKSNSKIYSYVNQHGDWSQWKIVLIDFIQCNSREEQLKYEQQYIDKYKNNPDCLLLNTFRAYTPQEIKRTQNNKRCVKYRQSEYETQKREQLRKNYSQKLFYCKYGFICTLKNKSQHKQSKQHKIFKHNPLLRININ